MHIVVHAAELPSTSWRSAFADALIRLRPDVNPDAADELSDSAYMRLSDLDPGKAALLCDRGGNAPATIPGQALGRHAKP